MAKIVDVKLVNEREVFTADKLVKGQMAKIVGPYCTGQIVIKIYEDILVSLNTQDTWSPGCTLEVEVLPIGTLVTLKQE